MMAVTSIVLAALLLLSGFVFSVFPPLPGPILAYAALFTFYMADQLPTPSITLLVVCGLGTAVVVGLDLVMPGLGAKNFNCSKLGVWGSLAGLLIGSFFFPVGLLVGPFVGALIGELLVHKGLKDACKGALGAFLGFIVGVAFKLEWCLLLTLCYLYVLFFR